ncbi:uncharacterized protein EI97DRAFT_155894 [Westerdykella ornata]|uniref:Uncharacterized protein n=1 Tax=Westerdykella ornata TaxID=318751 RepID=A0A6A6JAG1_WESOR|nr:uncharacterized protein EI97DRAFT_155894 [Westerdykella ornata]KAF2273392.1 hypothetical protein EI97DRAFT_155894 [Westerdykella ornata]
MSSMPSLSYFLRTPRPDEHHAPPPPNDSPASQTSSRLGALHSNVRSIINGSSIYSSSPVVPDTANSPKPSKHRSPFLGFLRRSQYPPTPIIVTDNNDPRISHDSRSPLRPQHTAGSYMRTIGPFENYQDVPNVPPLPETALPDRHPADVSLPDLLPSHTRGSSLDPETQQLQEEVHGRRRRHRRRHHHHHQGHRHHGERKKRKPKHKYTHWVRRKRQEQRNLCLGFVGTGAARSKLMSCLISGLFLLTVLAVYLALALTRPTTAPLGQELHILFIILLLAITIFFAHALIRLFMLALHPPDESLTPCIPSMTGPDGFHPIRPIRVHVARDEEFGAGHGLRLDGMRGDGAEGDDGQEEGKEGEKSGPPPPPPAYGLWRSSVRVDPNLLHWQRVEDVPPSHRHSRLSLHLNNSNAPAVTATAAQQSEEEPGPRPPSYVSDDGVSYVVDAAPRSTVAVAVPVPPPAHQDPGFNVRHSSTGISDIHPAWRPGYAMSEVRLSAFPAPLRV